MLQINEQVKVDIKIAGKDITQVDKFQSFYGKFSYGFDQPVYVTNFYTTEEEDLLIDPESEVVTLIGVKEITYTIKSKVVKVDYEKSDQFYIVKVHSVGGLELITKYGTWWHDGNSHEFIAKLLGESGVDYEIKASTTDKMVWICHGSLKKCIMETWLRSYGPEVILLGHDFYGVRVVNKSYLSGGPDYKFSSDDIIFLSQSSDNRTPIIHSLFRRDIIENNISPSGSKDWIEVVASEDPILTPEQYVLNDDAELVPFYTSDNTHPNWNKSVLRNLDYLLSLRTGIKVLVPGDQYYPFRIFDRVEIRRSRVTELSDIVTIGRFVVLGAELLVTTGSVSSQPLLFRENPFI